MKKIFFLFIVGMFSVTHLNAQEAAPKDTSWKYGGFFSFNASQVTLENWAAGGDNAVSGTAIANVFANYITKEHKWENSLDLGYGVITTGKKMSEIDRKSWRKNEDRLELNSKYGRNAIGKFYYSGLLNFRTQFADGFTDPTQTLLNSTFMAPGYLTIALGMDWKPVDYFSLFVSPATGKYTFVLNDSLAAAGAFGVEPGKQFRPEFGASMIMRFQRDIMKNVNLRTQLVLFNNYTDPITNNRKNIDVNWDLAIVMKVNKYISASIITSLIYDHDILITLTDKETGATSQGRRTQYKQVLGAGFSYKF
jgi:hypothetical protein